MARTTKPLSNTQIEKAKPKDKDYPLYDGQGLFLAVKSNGSKLWRFNYYKPLTSPPKRTEISLGAFPDVSLSEARAMREEYRALIAKGIDPKIHRDHHAETLSNNTFKAVCEKWFTEIYPLKATNEETRADNWKRMKKHIFPKIGDLPLRDITPRLLISLYSTIGASNTLDKLHRITAYPFDPNEQEPADKAGYRVLEDTGTGTRKHFYIFKQPYHNEVIAGFNEKQANEILHSVGMLQAGKEKNYRYLNRIPSKIDSTRARAYLVYPLIEEEETDTTETQ